MALFFGHFNEIFGIFFEILLKFNNFIKKLVKYDQVWHPTSISDIIGWQSKNRFNSAWTASQCIFCPKEIAWILTYMKETAPKGCKIVHWSHFD